MSQHTHDAGLSSRPGQARVSADEQHNAEAPYACRTGVAEITANSGGGAYTITEQRREGGGSSWQDAPAKLGHVSAAAIDYAGRTTGTVGQIVPFAEHRCTGGDILLLIDVGSEGQKVKISANDTSIGPLVDKLVGDDGTGSNVKVTFQELNDGGSETLKAVIAKSDIPAGPDQKVAVVSGDTGDYLGSQVKTFAGDSTDIGVTLEVDGSGESAKLQAKVAKSDIEAVTGGQTGFDRIITHTIKIEGNVATDDYTIDETDLRGKLLIHSSWAIDSSLGGNDWHAGTQAGHTPGCHDVESSPSSDVDLNFLAGSTLKLVVDANDGKLKWYWWTSVSDRYATCVVRVHNSIPDHTAS